MPLVDISRKEPTAREAVVEACVRLRPDVIDAIKNKKVPKGDVLESARIAGIIAAKKTPVLIPHCHPVPLDYIDINFTPGADSINVRVEVKGVAKTGMEMEAFTAASVACVTIYDMCKFMDREAEITGIRLIRKTGGKSGTYERK